MRKITKWILAGGAIAGLAAAGAMAADSSHVLTLRLPDGSQEQISYSGDVAPTVRILSQPPAIVAFAPALDPFGPGSPFAALERMSAAMDRQAAQMMHDAEALPAAAGGFRQVDVGSLPPGVTGYSVVSTFSGGRMCTHETRYVAATTGQPAKVLTSSSGDCGPARTGHPQVTSAPSAPPAAPAGPVLTRTGYAPAPRTTSIAD